MAEMIEKSLLDRFSSGQEQGPQSGVSRVAPARRRLRSLAAE